MYYQYTTVTLVKDGEAEKAETATSTGSYRELTAVWYMDLSLKTVENVIVMYQ